MSKPAEHLTEQATDAIEPISSTHGRVRQGFTLIEVLVVVAIIALLITVLLPSLKRAREQARTAYCGANLRQIGHGFYFYTQSYNGSFPGSGAWAEYIRPMLQRSLGKKSTAEPPTGYTLPPDSRFFEVEVYNCPGDPQKAPTSQLNIDVNGQVVTEYLLLSYAVNENVIWPLNSLADAEQNQDYSIIPESMRWSPIGVVDQFGERMPMNMRKITEVKRQSDIVLCADAGDDEVGVSSGQVASTAFDTAYWNWDIDWDVVPTDKPRLEIHHRTGNNFLFIDGHVSYYKVLNGAIRQGVPPVPRYWVPEVINTPAKP
jgi:prepilin-type N-terminal cleavage/methylation domain-containing protein/prepilin-type processing-associated H-X9-DG protein